MKTVKIGDVCDLQNGYAFKSGDYQANGDYLIRIKNVQNGYIKINDEVFVALPQEPKFAQFRLHDRDLVVSLTGNVGRVARIESSHLPAVLNQRVARIMSSDEKVLLNSYLLHILQSREFLDYVVACGKGAAQQNVSTNDISKFEIDLRSIAEQKAIVEKLDAAFAEIDTLESNLDTNIHNLSNNQDQLVNYVFKKYRHKLEACKLREVTEYANGAAHEKIINPDGKYIVVNSKFISKDGLPAKRTNQQLSPLTKGDLAMVLSDVPNGRALAKCYLVLEDDLYTLNQRICRVRSKTLNPEFLYFNLNRNAYLLSFNNSENQTNLRLEDVLNTPIFRADSSTQKNIVNEIDLLVNQFRKMEEINSSKLSLLRDLRQSILSSVFTEESDAA
jgi:type I restriction enzyme S subunit